VVVVESNQPCRIAGYTNPSRHSLHVRVMSIDSAIDHSDFDLTTGRLLDSSIMKAHAWRHTLPRYRI
jgi:hypothetical protein